MEWEASKLTYHFICQGSKTAFDLSRKSTPHTRKGLATSLLFLFVVTHLPKRCVTYKET